MKYTREVLQDAVDNSTSIAGVMRYLGIRQTGGSHAHLSRRIKRFAIDTSHFTRFTRKGLPAINRLSWDSILTLRESDCARVKPHQLRRALIEAGVPNSCQHCGIKDLWNGTAIVLHVDHINGNHWDCRKENLRFLCPNCHSQTATWAGRNRFWPRNVEYGTEAESA